MAPRKAKEQTIELKYTGTLDGAKSVYLHYGIGDEWNNITDCKMRKLKTCYKTEITVPAGEIVKFCFRDTESNWDNNCGIDYMYSSLQPTEYSNIQIEPCTEKKK